MYVRYFAYMTYTSETVTTVTSREFRADLGPQFDRVQHGGERLIVTRKGRPAVVVAPVGLMTDLDAYQRVDRGLSHVSIQCDGVVTRLTRDQLAAELTARGDQARPDEDHVRVRVTDLEVLSTLLGEMAASRTDALAELAGYWAGRLDVLTCAVDR